MLLACNSSAIILLIISQAGDAYVKCRDAIDRVHPRLLRVPMRRGARDQSRPYILWRVFMIPALPPPLAAALLPPHPPPLFLPQDQLLSTRYTPTSPIRQKATQH